ncbi:MAG: type VI secretion system tip protein VgrG [Desulfobacteraceae bacterium]|jgi:type VI secretion system secreted protein VgrG|nr:MAG: type VI secretion system tip protein VgrG [Desulfobacteraceae bacterium]
MKTYQEQKNFTFVSDACPEETFEVVRFKGIERISGLYEFDITLSSDDPDIDVRAVLQNPATFKIVTPDAELPVYGLMARFEQLQEVDEHIFYRGVLVPRFWQATLARDNELFLEKNVEDIIRELLAQTGLTSSDYDTRLTADYPGWEYICQFQESDFAFMSRRMEREGIYYYFEQTENGDKLIITDSSTSHANVSGQATISYIPPSGFAPPEEDAVRSFICRHQILPARVVLKDYNYRRPTLDLRGEADVDAAGGRGTVYIYGEHFKTTEEGNALARVRAEELMCREQVFYGESTAAHLKPGYLFELAGHYRDSYNQRYLIIEVAHKGKQTRYLSQGPSEDPESPDERPGYENQFMAIPADVQFRPERNTPRPKIYGTMNATIDAAGDGQYAEIDDEGRYKVVLPFDQSGNSEGRASRWVRMAQPYSGANYGMHFPLHKGTEVLLTFIDGDPDRPIISGSVPNPDTMSPVTGGNQTASVIRTGGGNQIRIEDNDGGQQIHLSSPTQGTVISLGAPNEGNLFFKTLGDYVRKVHGPEKRLTDGDVYVKHGATYKYECDGGATITFKDNVVSKTVGTTTEDFMGTKTSTMHGASHETFVGVKTSKSLAATFETYVGVKSSENLAVTDELFVGAKSSRCLAVSSEVFAGLKLSAAGGFSIEKSAVKNLVEAPINEIDGKAAVKITCGGSSIVMTPGSIKIHSPSVVITSSGGMVRMNGSVTIGGRTAFTDNVVMDEKLKVNGNFENPSVKANR